jgi:hypothetical protein
MINGKLKELMAEAQAKGVFMLPEKLLMLADLAEGLGLSAESVIHLTGDAEQSLAADRTSVGNNHL